MSKYNQYKQTGFDWIGAVPEHWEKKRFRYCFENGKGLSITKENLIETGVPCVNYGEIHSKFGFKVDPDKDELLCVEEKYLETNQSSILSQGDFVFADTSEDIEGSGNFSHLVGTRKIFAGYHTIISRLTIKAVPRFIAYYFDSLAFRSQIRREVQGVKVFSITNKILKDTILFLPVVNEQRTISNYLDDQTQKIDELIANKKAQVEKLKELRQIEINNAVTKGLNPQAQLEDSGIKWLGEIPKHWKVKRLKNCTTVISKGTTPSTMGEDLEEDGEIRFIKAENIANNEVSNKPDFFITKRTNELLFRSKLNEYDVLIVIAGATIGKTAIVQKENLPANTNQAVCFIRLNRKRLNEVFLNYWLHTSMIEQQIMLDSVVSAQPNLSMTDLSLFPIVLPSTEEQIQIANYLQQRTTGIDKLIRNIETQVEKLQELRKIKIYEAVTGKIKVNAYVEATA